MTPSEFFRIARRPRWIGALVLALALAAGFAALGQWQLSRSIENAIVAEGMPDSEKVGLVSMRERIRMVDGDCDIRSQPGVGTRVSARVPLRPPERSAGSTVHA